MAVTLQKPQIIVQGGRPRAVILGIKEYKKLLESAEEKEDLTELCRVKKSGASFRKFEDYLKRV